MPFHIKTQEEKLGNFMTWRDRKKAKAVFVEAMKTEYDKRKKNLDLIKAARKEEKTAAARINLGPSKKRYSEEIYKEVKRKKKERDLIRKQWPRIIINEKGKRSSLSNEGERLPLHIGDVQTLVLFLLLGAESPIYPRFATFIKVAKVSHVVMIHVEGIGLKEIQQHHTHTPSQGNTISTFPENEHKDQQGNTAVNEGFNLKRVSSSGGIPDWLISALPRTTPHMNHSLEVEAPSRYDASPVDELLLLKDKLIREIDIEDDMRNSKKSEAKKIKPYECLVKLQSSPSIHSDDNLHPNDTFNRLKLLMTPKDLKENQYSLPLPGFQAQNEEDFIWSSKYYKEVTSQSPMFGVDCEMCLTSINKLELGSISVVNEKHKVLYHTLVLPYNPVVNFMTKYSGITPAMLLNATKRLKDVQEDLRKLLPPDAILVGHSLNFDLCVLKMMHPYVIDSSVVYSLRGRKNSLKMLSQVILNEIIQEADGGHDPTEDAIASLKLVQLKLKEGECFGNVKMGWEPSEAMYQRLHDWDLKVAHERLEPKRPIKINTKEHYYMFQKLESHKMAIVTTSKCLNNYLGALGSLYNQPIVEVLSGNKQVSKRARDFLSSCNLTWVDMVMGKKLSQCPDEATRQRQLTKLDKRLQRIYTAAPTKSIHVYVFSGSSLLVPHEERSNGFVLVGIKGLPILT